MVEDIGTVIRKGFGTWTRNLNICVPFILEVLAAIVFLIFTLIFFMMVVIVSLGSRQDIDPANISPEEMLGIFTSIFSEGIWLLIIGGIILFLLYMVVQSFLTAGAIGMAKTASEKGNTNLSDMFDAGKNNFFNLFLTKVLVFLLIIAGLVFLIPGIISIGDVSIFLANPEIAPAGASLLLIGLLVWGLYLLALSIIFLLVDYALVIDGLDPISAIEKGISVLLSNKFPAFMIWILIMGISLSLALISEVTSNVEIISQIWSYLDFILSIIVIQPLIVVWLTRFYLNRTEKKLYSFDDYILDY
ncbi:DUF7847 domain-containing protein [Methanolobus psychrotolerans]|uniref:DUF7847 domain-containing protein n=1 Tax=Methanolobus psychrotolerans TaxID=1874706 RepID=UPI000B91C1A9|nr:hypothetical protein [Methanolobus psychrotolerans]